MLVRTDVCIGTWVPFERGLALAQQYNVQDLLRPILEFVKGDESPPMAPKHVTAASARPRKPREARRKRPKHDDHDLSEVDDASIYSEQYQDEASTLHESVGKSDTPSPSYRSAEGLTVSEDSHRQQQQQQQQLSSSPLTQQHHRPYKRTKVAEEPEINVEDKEEEDNLPYAQKLLQHFVSNNREIPSLLINPPRDLDVNVIIDDEGHTSLHWAAAMGQLQTVKTLIRLNADIYRVNYKGQTALMRSVLFTNNFDKKTFQALLDMLHKTIFNIDKKDQTVFHHVALTASWKGKVHASRYYMECLIDKLGQNRSELISILNVQDVYGDTALTIAARIGNKKLVRLLMEAGASPEIANEEGMTAQDYLTEVDRVGRLSQNILASPSIAAGGSEQAARARLRQKIESMFKLIISNERSVPAISQLFDGFAGSYERDLTQKEHAIKEKRADLQLTKQRLTETQRILDQIKVDAETLAGVEKTASELEDRLKRLTNYSQKERLAKLIKECEEEMERTEGSSEEVNNNTENETELQESVNRLEKQLQEIQQSRKELVEEIVTLRAQTPGKRYQEYKRLISMCCNVAYENVDVMLSPLLASFDDVLPQNS